MIKRGYIFYLSPDAARFPQDVLHGIVDVAKPIDGVTHPRYYRKLNDSNTTNFQKDSSFYQLKDGTIYCVEEATITGKQPYINDRYFRKGDLAAFGVIKVPIYVDEKSMFAFCEDALVIGAPLNKKSGLDSEMGHSPVDFDNSTIKHFLSGPFISQLVNLQGKMKDLDYKGGSAIVEDLTSLFAGNRDLDGTIAALIGKIETREDGIRDEQ